MPQAAADGRPSFGDWDASAYAVHRPTYPDDLFDMLAAECPRRRLAWDCAAGSGQATAPLAEHFDRVLATDINAAQIAAASADYPRLVCDAAAVPLRDGTVDLVVVAQALHWFAGTGFFEEVRRVAPDGLLAAWSYGLFQVDARTDAVVQRFYEEVVGDYWPAERRHIEAGYATIEFPFVRHEVRQHSMSRRWSAGDALAYLATWSAVRRYRDSRGDDPIELIAGPLQSAWGSGQRTVTWPLAVHLCAST